MSTTDPPTDAELDHIWHDLNACDRITHPGRLDRANVDDLRDRAAHCLIHAKLASPHRYLGGPRVR